MSEPPLRPLPPSFESTREAMHRLALHVLYLPRREAEGRYGLRATPGGFGTPVFGPDAEQVRVVGPVLVAGRVDRPSLVEPISSLGAAAALLGREVDPDFDHGFPDVIPAGDTASDLGVDPGAAVVLGELFGFADEVLRAVRSARPDGDPSLIQLWPEHFDIAFDVAVGPSGDDRANVGMSPGDGYHASPYFYVGPWTDARPGDASFWNAPFGAVLGHETARDAGDRHAQIDRVRGFFERGLGLLSSAR